MPDGSIIGDMDASTNPPENPELLHRPHAFALMHGDGGAKVAYGELHWRVDVFTLEFKQEDLTCSIDDHSDHTHTAGVGSHTHEHDHSHTTRPHTHDFAHTHEYDHQHDINWDSGSGYGGHDHGGSTDVPDTPDTTSQNTSTTGAAVTESGSAQSPDEATTGNINGGSGTVTTSGASATLDHTCTITPSQITYCRKAGQDAIAQITQTVPKVDAEDGDAMDATIPSIYHQLSSYGDVYLCWEVDLEKGTDVTNCWVQVGAPTNSDIGAIGLGQATTDRLDEDPLDDAGTEGAYSIKIGTVNENDQIIQNVSSDVVWSPTVMDRVLVT
jgi:hypothetical protein